MPSPFSHLRTAPFSKSAADLRTVAEKWKDKAHLVAALKQHLQDAAGSLGTDKEEKELADIAIIAEAYRKGFVSPMMMAERMKKFRETAGLPPLATTPANLLPPVPSQASPEVAADLATIDQLKELVASTPPPNAN